MKPLFILTCAALLGACSDVSGVRVHEFGIKVDSITAPDSIGVDDVLSFTVHGVIGDNDCYSFLRFEEARTPERLDLAAIGRLELNTGTRCLDVDVLLDQGYEAQPPFSDPFRIVIHQPDSDSLVHTVIVH